MQKIDQFNKWLAIRLGNTLSSMTFFYICVVLDLIELWPVITANNVIIWCTYLSQTVIQLIALPILGVLQKIGNEHHETTHAHNERHATKIDEVLASLHEVKEMQTREIEWIGTLLRSEVARREREKVEVNIPKRTLS